MSSEIVAIEPNHLPAAIHAAGANASRCFIEFFTANIRNPNTRRAYAHATRDFFGWLDERGVNQLDLIQPIHVAAWLEQLAADGLSAPTIKQRLAAVRMLFDWMILGQALVVNPAAAVRGPAHSVKRGKTPILSVKETRHLLDSIDTSKEIGLRDKALIALMTYSLARIGAALAMKVEDVYWQDRRLWVRLHEKGGKRHEMPCHHSLEEALLEYMETTQIIDDKKGWVFRTIGRSTKALTEMPLPQANAYAMLQRRVAAAGIDTAVCNHTFRATGITAYLKNGGTLEKAAHMANHSSTRTTQLYDRRPDDVSLDEVERIRI
jgi:site-specific recombinase XerD